MPRQPNIRWRSGPLIPYTDALIPYVDAFGLVPSTRRICVSHDSSEEKQKPSRLQLLSSTANYISLSEAISI